MEPSVSLKTELSGPTTKTTEVQLRGKTLAAPSLEIEGRTVAALGKWLKIASINDEELVEGELLPDSERFIESLRARRFADLFTFAQKLTDPAPRFSFPMEWDNAAVIPITTYADWWEKRLPQEARKNARRAEKRGVIVRVATFDDALVEGIHGIYNETPVRQGRPFWHYGKPLHVVKKENSTYLERCDFLGAYLGDELIGFIKVVYVDRVATLMQILARNAHQDKRPMNALLAKTVELCVQKQMSHLVYGKFAYNGNYDSPLTEFKRRTGFEELKFPRYYVPLTLKGRMATALKLHTPQQLVPKPMLRLLLKARSLVYRKDRKPAPQAQAD